MKESQRKTRVIDISKSKAFRLVILLGCVSLFADMTYEGARSITGPYLAVLGANGAIVGIVAGLGELLGYSLRLFSGYLLDKTSRYWTIVVIGYFINLLAVPLLALTAHWQTAACLMILERIGKAIRTPARDAMIAHTGQQLGAGWAFGLHEALDQTGAMIGPLIVASVLYFKGTYQESFAYLLIPALISLTILFIARSIYPKPQDLEISTTELGITELAPQGMNKTFWLYVVAASFIAAGYADFSLMAFHFEKTSVIPDAWIPMTYALAMGVSGPAALLLGKLYDRKGFSVLVIVTLFSLLFAPLVFWGGLISILIGICLWSIGLGAHESLMRAIVSKMVPVEKRGTAYGIFNMAFGVSWFIGSAILGIFYDKSISALIAFSVIIQLISVLFLVLVSKRIVTSY